jgi:hypothetical protein
MAGRMLDAGSNYDECEDGEKKGGIMEGVTVREKVWPAPGNSDRPARGFIAWLLHSESSCR